MRQLTAYASYLDNLGAPLVGRARFYNMDGSEAVVYSLDNATETYEEIGAIVFTNSSGQLEPQVFLADHDYLIVFDKYIGDGTMSEDDDSESWEEQGSAVDRYNTLGITLEGDSVRCIDNIATLRATIAVDKESGQPEVILLLGYYDAGDKEPIYYRWNALSTAPENTGSVIKVAGVNIGRWEMVGCPRYLDVRHFGAFPLQAIGEDDTQNAAIYYANGYAHAHGCGIYFDATPTAAYYDISGLTLYDVDSNPNAYVFAKTGEPAAIVGIISVNLTETSGYTGRIDLTSEEVRTSWSASSTSGRFLPTGKLIVDSSISYGIGVPAEFSNIRVDILVNPGDSVTFDNCRITAIGVITGPIDIENCELKTEWFTDNYDWDDLVSIGNTVLLKNCKDADTYILLKNKQSEVDYGDLGEQLVTNAAFGVGALVENCHGTASLAGDVEFHNVTLELTSVEAGANLNCIDSWLTFDDDVTLASLRIDRGSVSGSSYTMTVSGDFVAKDAAIDMQTALSGSAPTFVGCHISKNVIQYAHQSGSSYMFEGMMQNCILNAKHVMASADPGNNTYCKFKWLDNFATMASPIDFGASARLDNTSPQEYVYKGNTGTFVPTARRGITAASFTVANMDKGFRIVPVFGDTSVFLIGKGDVMLTVKASITSPSEGVLGMSEFSVVSDPASGAIQSSDFGLGVMFPDVTTDTSVVMYELARDYPNTVKVFADVELL